MQRAVGDGMVLSSTLMFDHPTARRVAAYLQGGALAGASPASAVTERNRAVDALVEVTGLSASLPSKVGRLSQLSAAAECSMDLLSEIPAERWDMEQAAELVADDPPEVRSRVRHGGNFMNAAGIYDVFTFCTALRVSRTAMT